jgi:murein DD-endopeptidase MepM/ murein hydrolase activator NlpD
VRRRLLFLALVTLVTFPLAGGAVAQQTDKQRDLTKRHTELSKAAVEAGQTVVAARERKAVLEASIGDLEARVVAAQAALEAAQAEVVRLSLEAVVLAADIETTQAKLADAEDDTKRSALLLYKHPDSASVINLIGSADGSGSLVEGKHYLEQVSEKRRNDLARAQRLRKTLDAQQQALSARRTAADEVRAQVEAAKIEIDALYAKQQAAREEASRQETIAAVATETYTAEAVAVAASLEEENERVRSLLANLGSGPPMGNGQLLRPIGGSITSGFGTRTDPISGTSAFHAGIDFGASCGSAIRAAGNGTVVSAGWNGGYGNATIIDHGGGMATLYGHQSSISVGVGQTVAAGEVIGAVGSTGKSTGCHLHFEVRINGNAVDPRGYI